MSDVIHVANPDGSHSIGVAVDGTFVAFVTLDQAHVADSVDRARELERRASTGDEEALKVVAAPSTPPPAGEAPVVPSEAAADVPVVPSEGPVP